MIDLQIWFVDFICQVPQKFKKDKFRNEQNWSKQIQYLLQISRNNFKKF